MKYVILLSLLMLISLGYALNCLPGSGQQVSPAQTREYDFSYHNGTDDYHFYGTDVWAVRFDFSEVYPAMATSEFSVTKALLYFPQIGDSVRVELFSDLLGTPGSSLTWAKVPVTSNNMEIPFPVTVQNDSLWLVVTYTTNFNNRFVSASEGGGSHSYYWNTNAQTPYFQSLSSAGYNAELLFGLAGDFVLSGFDLELVTFDLEGTLEPRETVGPIFSVYNHSDQDVTDAVVNVNVYSPDPDFAFFDAINIPQTIAPHSMYEFNNQSAGFSDHQFALPAAPMQLKLRAALSSGSNATDPQGNNIFLINRFSFEHPYPVFLTENFLRYNFSEQITALQDQNVFQDLHILNYFPILSDTLGNIASQMRFNWYGFNSLPRTVLNGDHYINGFSPTYGNQYSSLCEQTIAQKSLVSSSECRFTYSQQSDVIIADITLSNDNTLLYNAATEYNLIAQSKFFAGLFKKETFNGSDRYVISRWIIHASALDGTLGAGESYNDVFNIALNNLPLAELSQNYRLYYWLQLDNGGKILYSSYADFTSIVSNSDDLHDLPSLWISCNPLRKDKTMRIRFSDGQPLKGLQIYNIRGQKILDIPDSRNELFLSTEMFPSSGVYLVRVSLQGENHQDIYISNKINIIK